MANTLSHVSTSVSVPNTVVTLDLPFGCRYVALCNLSANRVHFSLGDAVPAVGEGGVLATQYATWEHNIKDTTISRISFIGAVAGPSQVSVIGYF